MSTDTRRDRLTGLLLVAPTLLLFTVLILYPLGQSLVLSLHRTSTLTLQSRFVGLDNFRVLLADPEFIQAFVNTLIWTAGAVTLQLVCGVGMALLLDRKSVV